MRYLFIILIYCFFNDNLWARETAVPVFISGTEGHKSYRIPAIIRLNNGDLLAFAEGRVNGSGDFGDINIVLKRSNDKGKTWYKTSVDEGRSWSEPVNITLQVHKPNQTNINPSYNFKDDWRHYANTPGHALQFTALPYRGRIYVAANHSEGTPQKTDIDYFAHGFYTNNHGISFKLSETVQLPGSNECTAAELSNGGLMLNARNQKGDVRARIVAISKNGGENWDNVYFDKNLPDPVCEGTILNIGIKKGERVLAFCNAADTKDRNNLTLRISTNEGNSWPLSYPVDNSPGNKKSSYTAYSDIVKISKHKIGVLYEKENYSQIVFKTVKW